MRYRCEECEQEFEAEEARCPRCLRQSSVVSAGGQGAARGPDRKPGSALGLAGLLTAIVIITPLMVLDRLEWHLGWWFTFVVALVGFGAGHVVGFLVARRKR